MCELFHFVVGAEAEVAVDEDDVAWVVLEGFGEDSAEVLFDLVVVYVEVFADVDWLGVEFSLCDELVDFFFEDAA